MQKDSIFRFSRFAAALMAAGLLTACGGGSGGGDSLSQDSTSSDGDAPLVALGSIEGFGSIAVRGVHYDVANARFLVNDGEGSVDDLLVGQVVRIAGTNHGDGTGVADQVTFDPELRGPVEAVDRDNSQLVAVGQLVMMDGSTMFEGTSSALLEAGDEIEVSGRFDTDGNLVASSVQHKPLPQTGEVEVKGLVATLDAANETFHLRGLLVDYANALLDPSDLVLADGQFVEVKGTMTDTRSLAAGEVQLEERLPIGPQSHLEVEGIIEDVPSDNAFVMDGVRVEHGPDTVLEDGTLDDLAPHARVAVEGTVDDAGTLQAAKIDFETMAEQHLAVHIEAPLEAVDVEAGTLRVLGLTVATYGHTHIKDSRARLRPFGLGDLVVGDFLEIRAFDSDGELTAGRIQRSEDEGRIILQASLDSADGAGRQLDLAGVRVILTDATSYAQGRDDVAMSEAEFFATVQAGDLVKVKGSYDGSAITATQVSNEQEGDESDDDDGDHGDRHDDGDFDPHGPEFGGGSGHGSGPGGGSGTGSGMGGGSGNGSP